MAAAVQAIEKLIDGDVTVRPLQDFLAVMARQEEDDGAPGRTDGKAG
jgi:hypothetical protein